MVGIYLYILSLVLIHITVSRCADHENALKAWTDLKHATNCKSLLKKHFTQEKYEKLKNLKTNFGGTLFLCIKSGVENLDSGVGIYASDPDAYTVFSDLLNPIIKDYHNVSGIQHPAPNFGDLDNLGFGDLDPEGKYIVSTRVKVARNHVGYGFPLVIKKERRLEMENMSVQALGSLESKLSGLYYPVMGMTKAVQDKLVEDHLLFSDHDRFLKAAGVYKDWPSGRGIFYNAHRTFLVWVNEEDHLRLISMQKGGNLGAVYTRLVNAIKQMEKKLTFAHSRNLGYLTFSPTNLGTTMRASVHIKIPNLSADPKFEEFCESLNLQARGIHGEHTKIEGGLYDISNKRRLGLSEIEAVREMAKGVEQIIKKEKELQGNLLPLTRL